MSKYSKASEEISSMVAEIAADMGLAQYGVSFEPLCVNKGKEVCKVVRANELTEFATKRDDLVFVIVFEEAFDMVDEETRRMWLRMEMDKVSVDTEKDKIVMTCPSITVTVGMYDKFKTKAIDSALLAHYTVAQIEERRKEAEAQRKAERLAKRQKKN